MSIIKWLSLLLGSNLTRSAWANQNACGLFLINRPALALRFLCVLIDPGWASQIWAMLKSKDSHLIMDMLDNTSTRGISLARDEVNQSFRPWWILMIKDIIQFSQISVSWANVIFYSNFQCFTRGKTFTPISINKTVS